MEQFPNPDNTQEKEDYYKQKIESIKQGNAEFLIRNFDGDFGKIHDYYKNRKWQGYIDQEYGYACGVFHNAPDNLRKVYETPALEDAMEYLERLVEGEQS
jgi:hypothetical protein